MNRALKFRRKLWSVTFVVVAILAIAFFLALRSARQAESVFEWSAHTEDVIDKLGQAQLGRSRLMNQLWAFRATRRPELPAHFRDDADSLRKTLADLRTLTADNPKQLHILNELTPLVAEQLVLLQKAMDDAVANNPSIAAASPWSLPLQSSDRARDLFNTMENDERALLAERSAMVHASVARTRLVLLIASALTAIVLSAVVYLVQREILLRATIERGLRRAQEMLGVKFEGQRAELGHVLEDLHAQIRARAKAEKEVRELNDHLAGACSNARPNWKK